MKLSDKHIALLRKPSPCFVTTLMPDGAPQTTETWVDTDGENVVINIVESHLKLKNLKRDPRVSVAVCDPANPSSYFSIRGRVTKTTTDGGVDHIESLSHRYLGGPYPWFGGRDQVRVVVTIEADKVHDMIR